MMTDGADPVPVGFRTDGHRGATSGEFDRHRHGALQRMTDG